MHVGSIHAAAAAARVYRALKDAPKYRLAGCGPTVGGWINGWELTIAARTTAVSTRISEVRKQLPDNERIECQRYGRGWWYRITEVEE